MEVKERSVLGFVFGALIGWFQGPHVPWCACGDLKCPFVGSLCCCSLRSLMRAAELLLGFRKVLAAFFGLSLVCCLVRRVVGVLNFDPR